jgi:MscS family membrane protein
MRCATRYLCPSQTAYFTQDTGLDAEKSREAETQVKDWRVKNRLPFPEFDKEDQIKLENKLAYPPNGPSHYKKRKDGSGDE